MNRDVSRWQRGLQEGEEQQELGAATQLFKATVAAFSAVLRIMADDPGQYEDGLIFYNALRDEFQKYYMWNEGFPSSSGELDIILSCSKNLQATVLDLLVQWARVVGHIPKVLHCYSWSGASPELSELEVLADKIGQVAEAVSKDVKTQYALRNHDYESDSDSSSESSSSISVGNFEDIVEDFKVYSESLMDLTPSLEDPARDFIGTEESIFAPEDELFGVSEPSRPFVLIIKDRFPSVEAGLVKKLGEANWQRRERLVRKLADNQRISVVSSSGSDTASAPETVHDTSRGRATDNQSPRVSVVRSSISFASNLQSVTTVSNFSEPSVFDRNSIHVPMHQQRRSVAESFTSFATSVAEGIENGQRRLPSLPSSHDFDAYFKCKICGDLLRNIRSRADWKKHVYDDLEPYVCLFPACSIGLHTFQSQREWMVHEFTVHRTEARWRCNLCAEKFQTQDQLRAHIDSIHKRDFMSSQVAEVIAASMRLEMRDGSDEICPFCETAPSQTQKAYARHVGRHLQEISLAALPVHGTSPDDDNDDDDSDDEEDGDGDAADNEERESLHSDESHKTVKDNAPEPEPSPPMSTRGIIREPYTIGNISASGLTPEKPLDAILASIGEYADKDEELNNRLLQRRKAIEELLDTEKTYLLRLNVLEEIYKGTAEACPSLVSGDVRTIFRNSNRICEFSTNFLDELRAASADVLGMSLQLSGDSWMPDTDLIRDHRTHIGLIFRLHLKEMETIYTDYLQNDNQALRRLNDLESDPGVKVWLEECYNISTDLVKSEAPSLSNLLSQPLRRINNYQLLLKELCRVTPDNHPDHHSLYIAYQEINSLAAKVEKMKEHVDETIKILRHKRKKSSLQTIFGLRGKAQPLDSGQEDEVYYKLHEEFGDQYLRLQVFMRDVESYNRQAATFVHTFLRYLSAIELTQRFSPSPYPELEAKWARFNPSMRIMGTSALQNHISLVKKEIIEPLAKVVAAYAPPPLAMAERAKRRLDYEKWLSYKTQRKKIDNGLSELARQYEALNETLKYELPRLFALTEEIALVCTARFIHLQALWYNTWCRKLETLFEASELPKDVQDIVDKFHRDFNYQQARIDELGIANGSFLDDAPKGSDSNPPALSEVRSRTLGPRVDSMANSPYSAIPHGRLSYDSRGPLPTHVQSEEAKPPIRSLHDSTSQSYDNLRSPSSASRSPDELLASSDEFSDLFHSAYIDDKQESKSALRTSSGAGYKVLYLAASLFEFNISATKMEAGYPYLTYAAGEIFDVIGEKGEMWLAKNQDDPSDTVGWIWSKHFARLASD